LATSPQEAAAKADEQIASGSAGYQWDDGWSLRIEATSCEVTDSFNLVGVKAGAAAQWDRYDRYEAPPSPSRSLSLYFPHPAWPRHPARYTVDIRDAAGSSSTGHQWRFDVAKSFADEGVGDQVVLEIGDLVDIPPDLEILLIDRELLQNVDLRAQETYSYFLGHRDFVSDESDARFQLLVGNADFIAEQTDDLPDQPLRTVLYQNRPNPFNPSTVIRYDLAAAGNINLRIYDISGALIKSLANEHHDPGRYEIVWRGEDNHGRRIASGVYFIQLVTSTGHRETRKTLLMR